MPHFLRWRRRSLQNSWKSTFSITPLSFDAPSPGNPRKYPHKLESLGYILVADSMRLSSFNFRGGLRKTRVLKQSGSGLSKVVDFGTNRKRVCDFLLIINSNFGPILLRFRDIAGFLLRRAIPPLFHPNFGDVTLGLDCRCCGSEKRRP